jgi:predicted kinase
MTGATEGLMHAMLVVFGGLPGTGKTTLAREVARQTGALHLRIDTIEQAIRASAALQGKVGVAGYAVALVLARENLAAGQAVIADAVNPVPEARQAWRDIAARISVPLVEIETRCSDPTEHRRRAETRAADIPGLVNPTWNDILGRDYVPWTEDHWVIDTYTWSVEDAVTEICTRMTRECPDPL